jgi:excisionase family DNA binding protein
VDTIEIPVWEKYVLTIKEASAYFGIGEHKLRSLIDENGQEDFILRTGRYTRIKRKAFEQYIDDHSDI